MECGSDFMNGQTRHRRGVRYMSGDGGEEDLVPRY